MRRRVDDELLDRALGQPEPAQHELEDLLRVSRAVAEAFDERPRPQAVREGRAAAMAAFRGAAVASAVDPMTSPWEWLPQLRVRALATAAVIVGILGALIAGGHGSLPGDTLYSVKLGVEEVRLVAAIDAIDEAKVHLDIAAARIGEVIHAREVGRTDAMRESLRRYTEAIMAVERELASGDLSTTDARIVLAEAAGTLQVHEEVLVDLRSGTPANAKPDLEVAIEALEDIELPPPPEPEPQDTPTPGPSATTTEPSPSPSESPSVEPSSEPSPEPSESPTTVETTPAPEETPGEGEAAGGGSDAGEQPSEATHSDAGVDPLPTPAGSLF